MTRDEHTQLEAFNAQTGLGKALHAASIYFDAQITRAHVMTRCKAREYTRPRFFVMAYMRWLDSDRYSYPVIARTLGFEDHTTVISGERRAKELFPDAVFMPLPGLFDMPAIQSNLTARAA